MTDQEILTSIVNGLTKAGFDEAEAVKLAPGMALTPTMRAMRGYDDEHALERCGETAAALAAPVLVERRAAAQASAAERLTAEQQRGAEIAARMARALSDPAFDAVWQRTDPSGHREAWRDYIARKASDPRYKL